MRILTISAEYPPFYVGGISTHTYELNRNLAIEGIEPWVITFCENGFKNNFVLNEEHGVYIARVQRPDINQEDSYSVLFQKQNCSMINGIKFLVDTYKMKFDLILVHGYFLSYAAIYTKYLLNVPIIYYLHTLYSNEYPNDNISENNIIRYAEISICYEALRIIAVSNYLKDLVVEKFDINPFKVSVITKAVDLSIYDSCNLEQIKRDYVRLLYVGRISEEKGIEVLIKAMKLVKANCKKDIYLYIVGQAASNDYLSYLKQLINEEGLTKYIVFLGFKTPDIIVNEYKSSDIVIVPSYSETFGKVAIEAMASKLPVIVSNVGGLGSIVTDKVNGILFEVGDHVDLSNKILYLINNPELAKIIGDNAYKEVKEKYLWDKIIEQTIKEYYDARSEIV